MNRQIDRIIDGWMDGWGSKMCSWWNRSQRKLVLGCLWTTQGSSMSTSQGWSTHTIPPVPLLSIAKSWCTFTPADIHSSTWQTKQRPVCKLVSFISVCTDQLKVQDCLYSVCILKLWLASFFCDRSGVSLAIKDNNGSFISTLGMRLFQVTSQTHPEMSTKEMCVWKSC